MNAWQNIKIFLWLVLLTGVIYPTFITLIAFLVMPNSANGSILKRGNKKIGSELIAQNFVSDKYFWGRPSAVDYNALSSGGSNLGPISKGLVESIAKRKAKISKGHEGSKEAEIPSELLFASGSGIDPHISPKAALFQIDRISKSRKVNKEKIAELIEHFTKNRTCFILGEPHVNVLHLNLALDELEKNRG